MPTQFTDLNWLLEAGAARARREPALRVNSIYGIFRAVLSGMGVAALPYYVVEEAPTLVEILPELKGPRMEAYFVYPEELRHSRRIDAVRDFLLDEVQEETRALRQRNAANSLHSADDAPVTLAATAELR